MAQGYQSTFGLVFFLAYTNTTFECHRFTKRKIEDKKLVCIFIYYTKKIKIYLSFIINRKKLTAHTFRARVTRKISFQMMGGEISLHNDKTTMNNNKKIDDSLYNVNK